MDSRDGLIAGGLLAAGFLLWRGIARAASTDAVTLPPPPDGSASPGPATGPERVRTTLVATIYYLALESDYPAEPKDTPLYDAQGNVIATVNSHFASHLAIEGSGRLDDGRVLNYATGATRATTRYAVLDSARYPWGAGVQGRALMPLRSLAVDHTVIPYGSLVYLPVLAGVEVPRIGDVGGFVHDGWFTAVDTGSAIRGNRVDVFSGTRAAANWLIRRIRDHGDIAAVVY